MLKIKNWKKFQHFKDRRPPWIKLYRDLLESPDWHELDAEASKALIMLWLIASENDGCLPDIRTISFRLRFSYEKTKTVIKQLKQWLVDDDIVMISEGYQVDAPETETETETDYMVSFEVFWSKYPRKEKRKESAKAYLKATKLSPHDEIMAGLERYLLNKPSYADWAHPSSWLNGERWKDNYEASVSAKPQVVSKNLVAGSDEWKKQMGIL